MKAGTKQARQRMFDKASKHLLTQMEKSVDNQGCAYRGANGLKCAFGVFITDYTSDMEGQDVTGLCDTYHARITQYAHDPEFGQALQCIHDTTDCHDWVSELTDLASGYGLDPSVLDEFKEVEKENE